MRDIAAGDPAAFRSLCDRFLGPITGYAGRMLKNPQEAEDVAQETFLRVWTHSRSFVPTAAVSTWLYRIAHNLCMDRLRKHKRTSDRISELGDEDRPSLLLGRKELAAEVDRALAELPDRQRAAIGLVHYEGMGQAEAARILDVSVQALESLLSRARRALRKQLTGLQLSEPSP